jgi:tetratricopeptide (TPR) repeat protein
LHPHEDYLKIMYLSGSKWNMRKKRRRSNPWRVLSLVVLIAIGVYFERVIVPTVPPPFIPEPTQTQSPVTFVAEAQAQFLAGKLEQAEQSYSRAIAVNPDEPAHYIELARLQVFQGKYEQAEENASNALLIDENSAMAYAVLAWAMDFNGKYHEAQTKIDYALVLDPNLALAHAYRAEILMDLGLGNYEEALDSANTAVVLDPLMLEAHRALGYVLEMTGNYAEAIEAYQTAVAINPNLMLLHMSVGDMYLALGDTDRAIESYTRASALSPSSVLPYRRLALANARIGEFGKASQWAEEAMHNDPSDPYLHGDLGRMYYNNNQILNAIRELAFAVHGGQMPGVWIIEGQDITVENEARVDAGIEVGAVVNAIAIPGEGSALEALVIEIDDGIPPAPISGINSQIEIHGTVEVIVHGAYVNGLPLEPGDSRAVGFYYTYGLALARNGQCELAREIARALLLGVPEDELAASNAEETLQLCGAIAATPTPTTSP